MKRNKLIAIAVGTIMGAALSSAYADQPPVPAPNSPQATQQATPVNPAPFGPSSADSDDRQTGGQQPAAKAPTHSGQADSNGDRRDIAKDEHDIARDRADIRSDRRDIYRDGRDIRANQADLRHEYAEQRAGGERAGGYRSRQGEHPG